jgi:hypothetical protein
MQEPFHAGCPHLWRPCQGECHARSFAASATAPCTSVPPHFALSSTLGHRPPLLPSRPLITTLAACVRRTPSLRPGIRPDVQKCVPEWLLKVGTGLGRGRHHFSEWTCSYVVTSLHPRSILYSIGSKPLQIWDKQGEMQRGSGEAGRMGGAAQGLLPCVVLTCMLSGSKHRTTAAILHCRHGEAGSGAIGQHARMQHTHMQHTHAQHTHAAHTHAAHTRSTHTRSTHTQTHAHAHSHACHPHCSAQRAHQAHHRL